ncbi:hypothetical protein ACFLXE_00200 [Chloroflexota bacterium]
MTIVASESLNDLVDRIRSAYYDQSGASYDTTWVRDVMDDSVIIEDSGKLYRVPWSMDTDKNITFDLAAKTEVEVEYTPLSDGSSGVVIPTETDDSEIVWKQLLRPGVWSKKNPYTDEVERISITASVIKAVKSAFDAGAVPHVSVPCEHSESPRENTGFVKGLKIVKDSPDPADDGLWCGIHFTEPDIKEMVDRGTIANVSAWLTPNYVDTRDGKSWSWALRHVALTNQPVLHLKPFAASSEADGDEVYSREEEVVVDKTKEEMQAEITQLSQDLEKERTRTTELDTKLSEATGDIKTLQDEKKASDEAVGAMETRLADATATLHNADVKGIIAAYQGQGTHEKVTMPAGMAFAPAVLSVVEPLLKADLAHEKSILLSVDGEEKASVTEIALSILNAVAAAEGGGLVSLADKGSQTHEAFSQAGPTEEKKEEQVDGYLKDRCFVTPANEA